MIDQRFAAGADRDDLAAMAGNLKVVRDVVARQT
jgi:hypothetical protein